MELARITEIYDRLGKLSLDLPLDPAGMGPEFLREQISLCRNYLNEASVYLQEVLQETSFLRMQLNGKEVTYKIRANQLLTQDPTVRPLPSIADRQARIDVILVEEKREIYCLQQELDSLSHVEKVVTFRKRELDNTMSAIRLQRSLLKDQIITGQGYGDESNKSRNADFDPADSMGGAELDAIIAEATREASLLQSEARPTMPAPESEEIGEDEAIATMPPTDFDLDSLVAAGGIDGTFEEDVTMEAAPQPVVVPKGAEPKLSEADMDPDMARFLSASDDDLDSLLSNV